MLVLIALITVDQIRSEACNSLSTIPICEDAGQAKDGIDGGPPSEQQMVLKDPFYLSTAA